VHVGGKLSGRAAIAAAAQPSRPGHLGVLTDGVSKVYRHMCCVFSKLHSSSEPPSGSAITVADGTTIPCWGSKKVTVTAAGRTFTWRFLMAAVAFALIDSDFWAHYDLQVDRRRLCMAKEGARGLTLRSRHARRCLLCKASARRWRQSR
jgi:hypothetical protein